MAEIGKVITLLCGGTATKNLQGNASKFYIIFTLLKGTFLSNSVGGVKPKVLFTL